MTIPRPEYPRPQFARTDWLCLNGPWQFEIDRKDRGAKRGLRTRELAGQIAVPFAPESEASGVGDTDFLEAVWYRRQVNVPEAWRGRRIVLHFGAVDHDTTVWVNDIEVARHRGGFTSFSADITDAVADDHSAVIVVRARDRRDALQARGKQSREYANSGVFYTRTTGIWQTVWLEPVPDVRLHRGRVTPNVAASTFLVELPVSQNRAGWTATATLSDADGVIVRQDVRVDLDRTPMAVLPVPSDRVRLWQPADPHCYDLLLELRDASGDVVDRVESYCGLRSVAVDGRAVTLNGARVFQRLVLDQGYWPQSLMTAPTDAALIADIELAMAAGFNGARLHQKVFEERFLYHADRLGYLVWAEFGDWGVDLGKPPGANQQPSASFITQWLEAVQRDANHPSVIGWCPLNETQQLLGEHLTQLDDVCRGMFLASAVADTSRLLLDASGWSHRVPEANVYDSHDYEQDPVVFARNHAGLADGRPRVNADASGTPWSVPYRGQPYFVSEFGGIWWNPDVADADGSAESTSWGYGQRVVDEEEFYARFEGLTGVLLENPDMFGYCYTQLTDVFQEENGIYRFDRSSKLDVDRIRRAQQRRAAYEVSSDGGVAG
jgi:beta-galactosidase/beta-glucuronidase